MRRSSREPAPARPAERLQAIVEHLLLQRYAPAAIVANRAGDIVHVHGRTAAWPRANWNVVAMAREELRSELADSSAPSAPAAR